MVAGAFVAGAFVAGAFAAGALVAGALVAGAFAAGALDAGDVFAFALGSATTTAESDSGFLRRPNSAIRLNNSLRRGQHSVVPTTRTHVKPPEGDVMGPCSIVARPPEAVCHAR